MGEPDAVRARVIQPDQGPSWWQPVPANGYAELRVARRGGDGADFSSGVQVIAPGGHVREHLHDANEELLFFFEGRGHVLVDGVEHPIVPGTTVFLGRRARHKIVNEGAGPLKMMWVLMPGGLEDFFAGIGRARTPGEPAPAPFPRPEDVAEIEAGTVFGRLEDGDGRAGPR